MKFRRPLWILCAAVGVVFLALQTRSLWLPWIAGRLVVADPVRPADVIAVFATGEERARHAARLYHSRVAPVILATGGVPIKSLEAVCEKRVTGAELTAALLVEDGVPRSAIRIVPEGTSTYEEGEAIRRFVLENGYRSIIVVSSPYHMRRVRDTMRHLLRGTAVAARLSPAEDGEFNINEWWLHERDFIRVANEYMKLAYYHVMLF